ncbi:hypothetical protein PI124_g22849 [Phytophthora idaei]|nr:hypothetical protein PI124_g22849 [Phytophthora idaei]
MMQQQQEGVPTTGTSSTNEAGAARGSRVMDNRLRPWALYDLSGTQAPDTLDRMKDHFRRFRGLRQKSVEGAGYGALQESWCAFIRRWNRTVEEDESFVGWLVYREEIIKDPSLSELRERVCSDAWEDMRHICYVRVAEGCESCAGPRPTVEEWKDHIAEYPLGEQELEAARTNTGHVVAWTVGLDHVHVVAQVIDLGRVRTRRVLIRGVIRRCKLGLVRLDHIWDVAKEVGTRLPRIFLRREAESLYLIPTRVWDIVSERQQQEGDRHASNAHALAGQDEDDLLNRYWDTQQELDKALDQAARATGETVQLRQSNREILARLRMLESSVHCQLQTGTQPRDPAPGTDGSMARRARREGRPTYVPAQEAEPTLES